MCGSANDLSLTTNMDTVEYKQAKAEMYVAMQAVFDATQLLNNANETLRLSAERIKALEYKATLCGDCNRPHKENFRSCDLCTRKITCCYSSAKTTSLCFLCQENIESVINDWPEDSAEALQNSMYDKGAYHALCLRIQANNNREAADDTEYIEERKQCLTEAELLDNIASDLLYKKADYLFRPWWFERWDYYRQPGYGGPMPKDASVAAKSDKKAATDGPSPGGISAKVWEEYNSLHAAVEGCGKRAGDIEEQVPVSPVVTPVKAKGDKKAAAPPRASERLRMAAWRAQRR